MASPKTDSGKTMLSDREMEILSKAWKCMKVQPEIDYTKLAGECGMTNIRSASNAWGAIKKKLFADMTIQSPGSAKKRKSSATASKAGACGKKGDPEGSDDDEQETPTKKRTRAKPKSKTKEDANTKMEDAKVKKEEDSDDDKAKVKKHDSGKVDDSDDSAGVEVVASRAAKHD